MAPIGATALLALSVLTANAEPRVSYGGPPGNRTLLIDGRPARYDAEADRLLSQLNLSDGLRLAAQDFVAIEKAKGISAGAAVTNWVRIHRRQGVVVRCKRIAADAVECVAR